MSKPNGGETEQLCSREKGISMGVIGTGPVWQGEFLPTDLHGRKTEVLKKRLDAVDLKSFPEVEADKKNLERIRKCWDVVVKEMAVEEAGSDGDVQNSLLQKSALTSSKLRQEGNDYYKKKEWRRAYRGFTLALCYAQQGSRESLLAYSNR